MLMFSQLFSRAIPAADWECSVFLGSFSGVEGCAYSTREMHAVVKAPHMETRFYNNRNGNKVASCCLLPFSSFRIPC